MTFREKLASRAKKAGISVQTDVIAGLEAYFAILQKWNRKVSLTSLLIDSLSDEAVDRLLIEPLVATALLPHAAKTIIDVGSGGGSPAIPIKIANPGLSMRMIESKTRKAAFLRDVVRQLALERTDVESARFEELLSHPELHESADVVTMRAVRAEKKTLMGLQAFIRPGGSLYLFRTTTVGGTPSVLAPLAWKANYPLLKNLNSELAVFVKAH